MPREDTNILGERTRTLGSGVRTTAGALSSANLASVPSIDVQVPENTPIFPVSGLNAEIPQLPQTQPEAQAQGFSEQLQGLFSGLEGESAFRAEQEQAQGLPALLKQQQDLAGRLSALQAEAKAIPLQIQQESIGRGRTRGGVAPVETARLRENAIQALSTGALLEASRGNIALAQDLADRAVAQKFDPIREEIRTAQANLQLVLESPEFSRAEKNRAQEQLFLQRERERGLENERNDMQFSRNLMVQAVQAGAPADIAQKMAESTPEGAIAIGAQFFGESFKRQAEQQAFDNKIKSRQIALQEAQFNATQKNRLLEAAKAGDRSAIEELGYDPNDVPLSEDEVTKLEDEISRFDEDIVRFQGLLDNKSGLELSSGLLRGGLFGSVLEEGRGLGVGAIYANAKKQDFLADANYIINNLTLDMVGVLSDRGIKLTPISEKELAIMGGASNTLAGAAQYDENGNLTGFAMSEAKVREEIRKLMEAAKIVKGDMDAQLVFSKDELTEISNIR